MLNIMRLCLGTIARLFCARRSLLLENLALRQQLAVFKRRHPRTRLTFLDKLFWVAARQICSDWKQFLIVVLPDTVVQWHRSGFALYWRLISRFPGRAGRKRIRAGKSVSPDFDVAVKRHQLLDLIQKASDTGIRQIL